MLALYDQQGRILGTLRDRTISYTPALSPDGTRIAIERGDEATRTTDIWVHDLTTGAATRITSDPAADNWPVWSPDGSQIAFASNRGGSLGLYRTAADGTGAAELLYRPSGNLRNTDWSPDGRFLTYFDNTSLYVLPLEHAGERAAMRIDTGPGSRAGAAAFSPDGRFLAYAVSQTSAEGIRQPWEVWVRPFDPSGAGSAPSTGPWQITNRGGLCRCGWRPDGKELYYVAPDGGVMAVEIGTSPSFTSGEPRLLFRAPSFVISDASRTVAISRDGQRFFFTEPPAIASAARMLVLVGRQGQTVGAVGGRGLYDQPVFSPDGTRVAVIKGRDLWVMDVASGAGVAITTSSISGPQHEVWSPVWSPDGRQVAYLARRSDYEGIYRKASDGEGAEELLVRVPGAHIRLTDWSMDGRFLIYDDRQVSESVLWALPLAGDREPVELVRSQFQLQEPRISPDGRFMAYRSNETGAPEIFVRAFDPTGATSDAPPSEPWQVSSGEGGLGMIAWRQDGTELTYMSAAREMKAVSVGPGLAPEFGRPRVLFALPDANERTGSADMRGDMSRDGQRVVLSMPLTARLRRIAVLDREGNVVDEVGRPGFTYDGASALSPDGTRVAIQMMDPRTGNADIWTFDVASGMGTRVTNDAAEDDFPIWSRDGRHLAYVSVRDEFSGIYRKAADGTADEEQLFQYWRGAGLALTDWSADGEFLTFHSGQVISVVPLRGEGAASGREAIEWLRDEFDAVQGRLSPDFRYMAYVSDEAEAGELNVFVRRFEASDPGASQRDGRRVQVSTTGAQRSGISWREDGGELYYLTPDWGVMAVDVTTTPEFQAGTPRLLFRLQSPPARTRPPSSIVSGDGQRFVFTMEGPVTPLYESLIPLVTAR